MTIKATNVTWHTSRITKEDRENRNGHKGAVVWFTGLSGSGKSTVAVEVEKRLFDVNAHISILDGDNVRHGLNKNLGFSHEDRTENIRRISEVAKLFADTGMIVLTAFISPYRADRDAARALLPAGEFVEVLIKADVETCIARDPKGLYQKAIDGIIKEFTGISAPYEEPLEPELVVDTTQLSVVECAEKVIRYLSERGILSSER
ncbi:adenylyl-sulfate kinase [Planctomycetota bacterium]